MFKQATARDGMVHFANLADHQSGFAESFNFPELDAVASMHRGERPVALKADGADLAAASVPNNDRYSVFVTIIQLSYVFCRPIVLGGYLRPAASVAPMCGQISTGTAGGCHDWLLLRTGLQQAAN